MKRDLDLVRMMLLAVEETPAGSFTMPDRFSSEGLSPETLGEHALMLEQAGFIEAIISKEVQRVSPRTFRIVRLTWAGHEYIDAVRSDTAWNGIKQTARDKGLDLTIDLVKAIATAKARAMLGLPPA